MIVSLFKPYFNNLLFIYMEEQTPSSILKPGSTAASELFDAAGSDNEEEAKEVTFDNNALTTPTKSTQRKSLVGLSPSQDAKVGMLKQMF